MRVGTRLAGIVMAGAVFAGSAAAQGKMEWGVDLKIASNKFDGVDDRQMVIGTPVDVRVGFAIGSMLTIEPRLALAYMKQGDNSTTLLSPGANVLWRVMGKSGTQNGLYLTGGVMLDRTSFKTATTDGSKSQVGFNVGAGYRIGEGGIQCRPEVFFASHMENGDPGDSDFAAKYTTIGLRFGFSFWH